MSWRSDRVGAALAGTNPTVLAELDAAFAVIGDVQWLPGYSLALTKEPVSAGQSQPLRAQTVSGCLIARSEVGECRDAGIRLEKVARVGAAPILDSAVIAVTAREDPIAVVSRDVQHGSELVEDVTAGEAVFREHGVPFEARIDARNRERRRRVRGARLPVAVSRVEGGSDIAAR